MLRPGDGGRRFGDDNGSADPRAAAALADYAAGRGSEREALTALARGRLLVPVVAVLAGRAGRTEKNTEMALATLVGADGRPAMLAFTCLDALAAWRADARPVPVAARQVCQSAADDGYAVVVDVAGPVMLAIEGARLAALAAGLDVPPAHQDPDVEAALRRAVTAEPAVASAGLAPAGDADLELRLSISAGGSPAGGPPESAEEIARRVAGRLQAALGGRLRRGVRMVVSVTP